MICRDAEKRLTVLRFWERHGMAATQDAFAVSRRTLFARRAQLRAGGWAPHALMPRSTRPTRLRRRQWPAELIEEIRRLRTKDPNLGKEKLAPFIARFCAAQDLRVPSVRTPGRLIADAPDKMTFAARRQSRFYQGRVTRRPRTRKPKGYRPEQPRAASRWAAQSPDHLHRPRQPLRLPLGVKSLSSTPSSPGS